MVSSACGSEVSSGARDDFHLCPSLTKMAFTPPIGNQMWSKHKGRAKICLRRSCCSEIVRGLPASSPWAPQGVAKATETS
jgi:hypothetical protein